jgi:hypothetical protein
MSHPIVRSRDKLTLFNSTSQKYLEAAVGASRCYLHYRKQVNNTPVATPELYTKEMRLSRRHAGEIRLQELVKRVCIPTFPLSLVLRKHIMS